MGTIDLPPNSQHLKASQIKQCETACLHLFQTGVYTRFPFARRFSGGSFSGSFFRERTAIQKIAPKNSAVITAITVIALRTTFRPPFFFLSTSPDFSFGAGRKSLRGQKDRFRAQRRVVEPVGPAARQGGLQLRIIYGVQKISVFGKSAPHTGQSPAPAKFVKFSFQ